MGKQELRVLNTLWSILFRKGLIGIPDKKIAQEHIDYFAIGVNGIARWSAPTLQLALQDLIDLTLRVGGSGGEVLKKWNYIGNAKVRNAYQEYLRMKYWQNQDKPEIHTVSPESLEKLMDEPFVELLDLHPPFAFFEDSSQKLLDEITKKMSGIEFDAFLVPNFDVSLATSLSMGRQLRIYFTVAKGEQKDFDITCSYVCLDR